MQSVAKNLEDLDGDGKADLVTANTGQAGIGVGLNTRKGDGAGGFGNAATLVTLLTAPTDLTVADFNVDGIPDIAVSHQGGGVVNTFSYLLGKAGLTYNAAATVAVNNGSDSILAAPFNTLNDNNYDVVTTSTTVNLSIVLNQCQ
jgi:hypothetical protein